MGDFDFDILESVLIPTFSESATYTMAGATSGQSITCVVQRNASTTLNPAPGKPASKYAITAWISWDQVPRVKENVDKIAIKRKACDAAATTLSVQEVISSDSEGFEVGLM